MNDQPASLNLKASKLSTHIEICELSTILSIIITLTKISGDNLINCIATCHVSLISQSQTSGLCDNLVCQ